MQNSERLDGRGGYVLPELVATLLIVALVSGLFLRQQANLKAQSRARLAGHQLLEVIEAAGKYIQANAATLAATATADTAELITGNQIADEGFLPSGWSDQNAWGQSYLLYVIQPLAGQLTGYVVTTGGDDISSKPSLEMLAPLAVEVAGANAGYVPPTGHVPGESEAVLVGNGWDFDTTAITNYVSPGAGHLAGVANLGDATAQDYLYRVGVPGSPERNQMQTNLDMGDNSITTVGSLQLESRDVASMTCSASNPGTVYFNNDEGLFICRDGQLEAFNDSGNAALFKGATMAAHGDLVPKVQCPSGTGTSPRIFVSQSIVSEDGSSPPLNAIQPWAVDSGTDWLIQFRVLTDNGWTNPTSDYGRVVVFQMCE